MRILYITNFHPFPPNSGAKIRSLSILSALYKKNSIDMVALKTIFHKDNYYSKRIKLHQIETIQDIGKRDLLFFAKRILRQFTSTYPDVFIETQNARMQKIVLQILKSNTYDLIIVEPLWAAMYVIGKAPINIPILINELNAEYVLFKSLADSLPINNHRNLIRKIYYLLQGQKMKYWEDKCIRNSDMVLCTSDKDKKDLQKLTPDANLRVVPNTIDTNYIKPKKVKQIKNSLLFIGTMNYRPNKDAVIFFTDKILPLIKNEIPDIKLFIVGNNPSDEISKLNSVNNITVTGYVKDHRNYLYKATCIVAPMTSGSGTNLKIVEALAAGKPAISTKKGVEGLDFINGVELLIATSTADFAQKTIKLLNSKSLRNKLAKNARNKVVQKYSWLHSEKAINSLINNLRK